MNKTTRLEVGHGRGDGSVGGGWGFGGLGIRRHPPLPFAVHAPAPQHVLLPSKPQLSGSHVRPTNLDLPFPDDSHLRASNHAAQFIVQVKRRRRSRAGNLRDRVHATVNTAESGRFSPSGRCASITVNNNADSSRRRARNQLRRKQTPAVAVAWFLCVGCLFYVT